MSGWGHTVSLNSTDGFRKTIWNLGKSLGVMWLVEKHDIWLAPIVPYKPCAPNHLLVKINAFARGQNLH